MAYAQINGLNLFYEWHGASHAPAIVFVNGLLTDTSSWMPIVSHFDRYHCLLYDCRGQGLSDKPDAPHTTAQHAGDLVALLNALQIEQAAIIGLSNGGAAALRVAAEQPERVAALVVSGAYAQVDGALRAKLTSWISAMDAGGSALRFDVATPWVWGETFLNHQYKRLLAFREKGAGLPTSHAHNLIQGALEYDVFNLLPRITAPTLVIVGEEDVLTPPKQARAFAAHIPNARVEVMPNAGHAAALEQPDNFATLARSWIDQSRPLAANV